MMPRNRDRVALILAKMKRGSAGTSDGPEKNSSVPEWKKPRRAADDYSESDVGSEKEDSESSSAGLQSAADDILRAVRDDDSEALVSALIDFLHIHADECAGDEAEEERATFGRASVSSA